MEPYRSVERYLALGPDVIVGGRLVWVVAMIDNGDLVDLRVHAQAGSADKMYRRCLARAAAATGDDHIRLVFKRQELVR